MIIGPYSPWECEYCDTKNTFRQDFCGEGTVNGCGAKRCDGDKYRSLAGFIRDGELIYYGDRRLPDLIMREDFAAVLRI